MKKIKKITKILLLLTFISILYAPAVKASAPNKREFRAAWVATVGNIDWPSKSGLSAEEQKKEFINILNHAVDMNLNAVIVQIRPTADAFYKSEINPWTEFLTGTQGKDPGYDPLSFMIEEAHKRNLEFHAWFNPFRVSNSSKPKVWSKDSAVNKYPDLVVDYDNKKYLDPGNPKTRELVINSIMEVVKNYDVDAIHFDDYFYPYPTSKDFPDSNTFKLYNRGFKNKSDWRRDNINIFIKSVYENIKAEKEYVKLGVSPFGIWRNKSQDINGSNTTSSVGSYDSLNADTLLWVKNGWLDYIAPQIYWEFNNKTAPYGKVFDFWVKEISNNPDVQLYIGHACYKIGSDANSWKNPNEMPNQINHNRLYKEVSGSIFYNISSLLNNPLGFTENLISDIYKYPALIPATPLKDKKPPNPVKITDYKKTKTATQIYFENDDENAAYFVIYKSNDENVPYINNPATILRTIRNNNKNEKNLSFVDTNITGTHTYLITSVDRLHNESNISNSITIK